MKLNLLMFVSTLAFVVSVSSTRVKAPTIGELPSWDAYKRMYNKKFRNYEEECKHEKYYCDTIRIINEHNKRYNDGLESYSMGVNQFSDINAFDYYKKK